MFWYRDFEYVVHLNYVSATEDKWFPLELFLIFSESFQKAKQKT